MRPAIATLAMMFYAGVAFAEPLPTPAVATPAEAPSRIDKAKAAIDRQVEKLHEGKTGAALVTANILSCAGRQVGTKAAYGFYGKLRQTTSTIKTLCQKNNPSAAKATLLSAIQAHKDDAATKAVVRCYRAQGAGAVVKAVGPAHAARADTYARWSQDPALAQSQMTDRDVCGG